jgi:hypothetical protein
MGSTEGFHFGSPLEGLLLLRKCIRSFFNVGETGSKPSVISIKTQGTSYFVLIFRGWSFPYGFQLIRVDGHSLK